MEMSLRKAAAGAALLCLIAAPAAAQSGWTMVGYAVLDGGAAAGTGTIRTRWQAQFREIMFCAEDHAVHLTDATVRFRDGRTQNVRVRMRVANGGCSRMSNVGRNRDIEAVDLSFDAASLEGQRARVQLFGR
jgi:hypothetical protein